MSQTTCSAFVRRCAFLCCVLSPALVIAQQVPRSSHVWIINEENHSYGQVVGSSQMPYFNSLIQEYTLATRFYSNQRSSLPALMWFVAGAPVTTNNSTTSCQLTHDNVVRELLNRGYTWRAYEDDMPYAGYQKLYGGTGGYYYRRHNPLIDFSDVCPGTGQDLNSAPFPQMAADFDDGTTVNFAWVTPDVMHDAESGTLLDADAWLQANVPAILARPEFASGGDGILFIVWDEGKSGDYACSATVTSGCGGHTAIVLIGPQVKRGYRSTITYHNENVLATVCAAMGLSPCPGAAANAAPMADFFTTGSSGNPSDSVLISSPASDSTISGSVHLIASASESQPVSQMQVWDNGVKLGAYPGDTVDQIYNLAAGQHKITVSDHDSSYKFLHKSSITCQVVAATMGVQVSSPVPNETFDSTSVQVIAQAQEPVPVRQMQVWDNGTKLGAYSGSSVNAYFNLAPGSHTVSVVDLDDQYNVLHRTRVSYSVQ